MSKGSFGKVPAGVESRETDGDGAMSRRVFGKRAAQVVGSVMASKVFALLGMRTAEAQESDLDLKYLLGEKVPFTVPDNMSDDQELFDNVAAQVLSFVQTLNSSLSAEEALEEIMKFMRGLDAEVGDHFDFVDAIFTDPGFDRDLTTVNHVLNRGGCALVYIAGEFYASKIRDSVLVQSGNHNQLYSVVVLDQAVERPFALTDFNTEYIYVFSGERALTDPELRKVLEKEIEKVRIARGGF